MAQARARLDCSGTVVPPFMGDQPAFAVEAAAIAGQGRVGADHPVAGHNDGDRVGAVGEPDGAAGGGAADALGEVAVADRRAGRDAAQFGPDLALERCAAGLHRQTVECGEIAVEIGLEYGTGRSGVSGGREGIGAVMQPQQAMQAGLVVVEVERAEGGAVGDEQDRADRRGQTAQQQVGRAERRGGARGRPCGGVGRIAAGFGDGHGASCTRRRTRPQRYSAGAPGQLDLFVLALHLYRIAERVPMSTRVLIDHREGGVIRHPEKANRPSTPALRKPDWIRVRAPNHPGLYRNARPDARQRAGDGV